MTDSSGQAFTGEFDPATARILPSDTVTHVHLLRHGEVADFTRRVVRGQMDVELSPRGREHNAALARWFARVEPQPDVVYTSDLVRCGALAEELGALVQRVPIVDVRLREQSMGRWEGRTWAEITEAEPRAVTAYWDDYHGARPTGGESVEDLEVRVLGWWREILARSSGKRVAVVTHIGVIRVLLCHWLGLEGSQALRFTPATASHTAVEIGEAGAVVAAIGERPWSYAGVVGDARAALSATAPRVRGADDFAARTARPERGAIRLALAGSAGTGKTTLGRRIAAELGLQFIEERMRQRLETGFDLHDLTPERWRALMAQDWAEQRDLEDSAQPGFVADRSSFDYAAFWLHYGLYEDVEPTEVWMRRMFAEVERYDRILVFPWGSLPLAPDGVRSTNRWTQLRFQALLEGLLERFAPPSKILRVPPTPDFESRLAFVLRSL